MSLVSLKIIRHCADSFLKKSLANSLDQEDSLICCIPSIVACMLSGMKASEQIHPK